MTTNLIFDMDGTLIDSYDSIVDCIVKTNNHFNVENDRGFIREMIQKESTSYFFKFVSMNNKIEYEDLWNFYNNTEVDYSLIKLMPHAIEMFEALQERDVKNYVYTHRGPSVFKINKLLGIDRYLTEVVNLNNGFKRKPDPEGIDYLISKYNMQRNKTYYIGDRLLDQECAKNAGVNRVYYQSYKELSLDSKDYDYYLDDLLDITKIGF